MSLPVPSAPEPQSADAVLMIRPAAFGFNPQTAESNTFQSAPASPDGRAQPLALGEFDRLADSLRRAGVEVVVANDTPFPVKPDAIFPNNWVSFHHDGSVVLYPMLALNRRLERRDEVLRQVAQEAGRQVVRAVDLSHRERQGKFLEGTGSLVLDRPHRIAYASLSPRTDLDVLGEFAQLLDYELVTFEALDATAKPIYHTNVLMAVGTRFAVICGEAIVHPSHRIAVAAKLRDTGHEIIDVSIAQMDCFACNLLELAPAAGNVIALSTNAWRSFDPAQRLRLEHYGAMLTADIPTIEHIGGGGVRCMLAEIHLPKTRSTTLMS